MPGSRRPLPTWYSTEMKRVWMRLPWLGAAILVALVTCVRPGEACGVSASSVVFLQPPTA